MMEIQHLRRFAFNRIQLRIRMIIFIPNNWVMAKSNKKFTSPFTHYDENEIKIDSLTTV